MLLEPLQQTDGSCDFVLARADFLHIQWEGDGAADQPGDHDAVIKLDAFPLRGLNPSLAAPLAGTVITAEEFVAVQRQSQTPLNAKSPDMAVSLQADVQKNQDQAQRIDIDPFGKVTDGLGAGRTVAQQFLPLLSPVPVPEPFLERVQTSQPENEEREHRKPDGTSGDLGLLAAVLDGSNDSGEIEDLVAVPEEPGDHWDFVLRESFSSRRQDSSDNLSSRLSISW
jgi:hypothetical protein